MRLVSQCVDQRLLDAVEGSRDLLTELGRCRHHCNTNQGGDQAILDGSHTVFVSNKGLDSGKDGFHDKLHMVVYKNKPETEVFPDSADAALSFPFQ